MRIPMISLMAAGALALGGCTDMYGYNGLGVGVGYGGYGGYGYGSPYYGASYGYPYGGYGGYGYGYGYGSPYYGWYDDYYYPGTGYYVYDSYRRPHSMTPIQKAYWSKRSPALSTRSTTTTSTTRVKPNWSAFSSRTDRQSAREARRRARDD